MYIHIESENMSVDIKTTTVNKLQYQGKVIIVFQQDNIPTRIEFETTESAYAAYVNALQTLTNRWIGSSK